MQTYELSARAPLARCSSFSLKSASLMQVHDAPRHISEPNWEDFDINSIPQYIAHVMPRIYANLDRLESLGEPYLPSQASELLFMIEAVLTARNLIE